MSYNYITLSAAETLLASILTDSSKVRFISDELQSYIIEALRTFSGLTGMWEEQTDPENIAAGTVFVDLPTIFPDLREYTVTDQDLVGIMQYHLLEPKSVSAWTGTEMFTLADLTNAIQRRRDQFLLETGCRLTRTVTPASPTVITSGQADYALDQNVMQVVRACWQTTDGKVTPLWQDSRFGFRANSPRWNLEPGLPKAYRLSERSPMVVEFAPPPLNDGRLDLLTVIAGDSLDPTSLSGVLLGVPDDFGWIIKWGALSDLLSKDGPARDYARALFCERRYRVGVAAAFSYRPVSDARINGATMQIDTIEHLDMARPYWQSKTGTPTCIATAGHNIVVIEQPPKRVCQLQATMKRNVPVPASGAEFLQIGKEYLDIILGYATHLAMFKIGGQELAATTHLAESFFLAASDYNDQLKSSSAWEDAAYPPEKVARMRDRGIRRVTGSTVSEAS